MPQKSLTQNIFHSKFSALEHCVRHPPRFLERLGKAFGRTWDEENMAPFHQAWAEEELAWNEFLKLENDWIYWLNHSLNEVEKKILEKKLSLLAQGPGEIKQLTSNEFEKLKVNALQEVRNISGVSKPETEILLNRTQAWISKNLY